MGMLLYVSLQRALNTGSGKGGTTVGVLLSGYRISSLHWRSARTGNPLLVGYGNRGPVRPWTGDQPSGRAAGIGTPPPPRRFIGWWKSLACWEWRGWSSARGHPFPCAVMAQVVQPATVTP